MTLTREQALALGHPTLVVGPAQLSLVEVPGHPEELYVFNWIVNPEERGKGKGHEVFEVACWIADAEKLVLVTHPDTPKLRETMERYGFHVDESRPRWEDKPFMTRPCQQPGEPPAAAERLSWVN